MVPRFDFAYGRTEVLAVAAGAAQAVLTGGEHEPESITTIH